MTNYDAHFNADRRTAAFEAHERGTLACLAGPGTGKTYSLLARSRALTARGVAPSTICYLTFIRAISDAFIDDYTEKFGQPEDGNAPRISTLHSFACRLLRNQGFRVGYDGDLFFTNITEDDDAGTVFLEDLLGLVRREGCRTIPQLRSHAKAIQSAWQNRAALEELAEPSRSIAGALDAIARNYRLADFDQAVNLAVTLLGAGDAVPDWIASLKHFFVDEYQDFNRAEQEIIRVLSTLAESVVVVGDDDQSLYSGRGGSPEGMRELVASPLNDTVSLVKCYRCREKIVLPTNQFQLSMESTPRPMIPVNPAGDVRCFRFKSSKAEVGYIADYLAQRLAEMPATPKSKDRVVCLFPSRKVLRAYYEMLSPLVPCEARSATFYPDRQTLKRVFELLARSTQRFAQRLVLTQFGAFKPRHRKAVVQRILERGVTPEAAVRSLIDDGDLTGEVLDEAREFVDLCAAAAGSDVPRVAAWLAQRFHVDATIVVAQLSAVVDADASVVQDTIESSLDIVLPATVTPAEDPHRVQFLTMHSSKGLTRRVVVLPGLEEACLPGDVDSETTEERARLFFVALTRATDHLLLTFPLNRGGVDKLNFRMEGRGRASTFLARAGLSAAYQEFP